MRREFLKADHGHLFKHLANGQRGTLQWTEIGDDHTRTCLFRWSDGTEAWAGHKSVEPVGSWPIVPLGQVVATTGALAVTCDADTEGLAGALCRHLCGDWGDVDASDKLLNDTDLVCGGRLLSRYNVAGTDIYIVTEADRSVTTIMLCEEY